MKRKYAFFELVLIAIIAFSSTKSFSQATLSPSGNISICNPPGQIVLTANLVNAVTYLWSNGSTDQNITVSSNGQYFCTVTDNNSVVFNSDTADIAINPIPVITVDSTYGVTCNGFQNGYISISGSGGTGPYSYSLNGINFQSSGLFENLGPGNYIVTISDNTTGCSTTGSYLIIEPANLDVPFTSSNNLCFGFSNGIIDLQTTGGTPPYTFLWSNGSTDEDQTGLVSGIYTVLVTDFNGCVAENVIDITQPSQFLIGKQFTNVSCANGADGTALISVNGGMPPYSYLWSNGETTDLAIGLGAGFHSVSVTDQNGCAVIESFLITEPAVLDAQFLTTDVSCSGNNDGTASVSPFGGTPYSIGSPYLIVWNTIPVQTGNTATGLVGGTYVATVTDSTGCTNYVILSIDEPDPIVINLTSTNPYCFGGLGEATALAVGGTGSYSYSWNTVPSQTINTATGLSAGSYEVTITDSKGCTASSAVNISNPASIVVTPVIVDVTCNGGNNGQISLSINPNNGGYSFIWNTNPAATTSGISGLHAGTYSVVISYGSGCTFLDTYIVSQPSLINCNSSFTNVTCFGGVNGTASVNPSGGVAPYIVLWSNGSTTNSVSGLVAGIYTSTITDANGCVEICNFTISENSQISITPISSNVTCYGSSNGSINLNVSGGSGNYIYLWSNGNTTNSAGNLSAGTYTIVVTDGNSCTQTISVIITQPSELSCVCNSNVTNVSCFGGNDGQITVLPFGGTPPYSYIWSSGQSTQTISGLVAGTYTVTISDANGCARIGIVQVTQPSQLFAAISCVNNVSCAGNGNGSACINGIGGTLPYTYSWSTSPIQTGFTATGLVAGTYVATITDSKGCTATASVTIAQPNSTVSCTISKTDVACFGQSNGNASVTAIGGTGSYTYLWSTLPSKTTQSVLGLNAGVYFVTVTDANGCSSSCSVTINQPSQIIALYQITNIACNLGNNGAIDVTVTGGTVPYSYLWSNGATTEDLSGITAGVYILTILDNKGCAISATFVVSQPSLINISKTKTNVTCYNSNNGTATISVTNGVAPYSYQWSNGAITSSISNLSAGIYTVTVTDANGCTKSTSVSITQPTIFSSSTSILQQVQCNNNNGIIQVSVIGGVTPFAYSWTTSPIQTLSIATGLSPGTYYVVVYDSHGCTTSSSASLIGTTALSCNAIGTDVSCNGGNDGTASVTASGGTAPYTYLWNTLVASTNSTVSGLTAGTYSVILTDASGCTSVCSVIINQPSGLAISLSSTIISCDGGSNGTATVNISGGTNPYSYLWSDGQTTQTSTGLISGTYSVIVTDNKGCTISQQIILNNPAALTCLINGNDATCYGNSNGSATVNATGGTGSISYLWSTIPPQFTSTATGLAAGNYIVTVTDINGCSSSCSVQINSDSQLSCSIIGSSNPTCFGNTDGSATVSASGGTGGYTYMWSTSPVQTSTTATGLIAGNYNVTITDGSGCSTVCFVLLSQPSLLSCSISGTNTSCGLLNGYASVNPSGGTPGYTFLWSNGQTSQTVFGLAAGTYTATVTDSQGCTSICNVGIAASNIIFFSTTKSGPSCNGLCDGIADVVTISGGVAPFTFLWSNGQTSQNASGLCGGTYTITVTDVNGCSASNALIINQPAPINLSFTILQSINCYGNNNGTVKVTATGGSWPYAYLWSNGNTTNTATGLTAGNYTVFVTDSKGCTNSNSIQVTEPADIIITTQAQSVLCSGGTNGSATAIAVGGTGILNYLWSTVPGQIGQTATGLSAGTYFVTVTDANGCTKSASAIISEPSTLSCSISTVSPSCSGGNNGSATINVLGGTPGFSYVWSNGATTASLTDLTAGIYSATITDNNGCTSSCSATIIGPQLFTCSISKTDVLCNEGSTGTATVNPTGGTPTYSYLWSNGQTTQTIIGLPAGIYSVTVTDNNNCTSECSILIAQPNTLEISFSNIIQATCGNSNGSAMAVISGGTPSFTYLWSNGQGGSVLTSVLPGIYTVSVTDFNGCTATGSLVLSGTNAINLIISAVPINCYGQSDGSASVIATGGNGSYNYLWNTAPVQSLATATGLSAGNYQVLVSDVDGCTATASTDITQPTLLTSSASSTPAPCGTISGSATVTANGGTPAYSYLWSNGKTTSTITGLSPGTFTVTVTDSKGCSSVSIAVVAGGTKITAIVTQTTIVNCFGGNTGAICVTGINGGIGPYSYLWSNTATTNCISNLIAGSYTVTVTDIYGCTRSKTINVTQKPLLTCSTTFTNTKCGLCNGTAISVPTGGSPYYSYQWSTSPVQVTKKATGLCAGVYTVTVTDFYGCTTTCSVSIGSSIGVSLSVIKTDVSCFGGNNGSATALPTGGNLPYGYLWSNGNTTQTIIGLTAGSYTVTVSAALGCKNSSTIVITQPSIPLSCNVSTINGLCGIGNGSANVIANGGTAGYTYLWNTGATNDNISNLTSGTYSVTVTDANGCTTTGSGIVIITDPPICSITGVDSVCSGESTTWCASAGQSTYLWSTGATTQCILVSTAGNYSLLITDLTGCTSVCSKSLTVNQIPSCSINGNSNVCSGSSTQLCALGGLSGYLWNTGATTQCINVNATGNYIVTVSNGSGCTSSCSQTVTVGSSIVVSISKTDILCNGGSNATATASATGGTSPYSYLWNTGSTSAAISSLGAGNYTVTVTDANSCTKTGIVTINQPAGPVTCTTSTSATACNALTGTAAVVANGGTPGYTYLWNTGSATTIISGLAAGTYTVTVTDLNGCSSQCQAVVSHVVSNIYTNFNITRVTCFGGNNGEICLIGVGGGVAPYSFMWSNGQTTACATGLTAGNYTLTITDANGCTTTRVKTQGQNAEIVSTFVTTPATCGTCNGTAIASTSGGVLPYSYQWSTSPAQTTITATGLCKGFYTLVVTDKFGCTSSANVEISGDTSALSCDATVNQNISCFGLNDGSASVTATGSSAPYSYLWSNGSTDLTINNLAPGTYTVTVTSFYNCTSSCSVTITSPTAITNSFVTDSASSWCNTDAAISASIAGGTLPYSYLWSNGQTISSLLNIQAGVYTLTVIDGVGCAYIDSANVGQPTFACDSFLTGHPQTYYAPGPSPGADTLSKYLDVNFSIVYPTGMVLVGNCPGAFSLTFTSPTAVKAFISSSNKAIPLTQSWVDPLASDLNSNLAAQLVTLKLNIDFDLQNPNFAPTSTVNFQDLVIDSGSLTGMTVKQLFNEGRNFLSGCGSTIAGTLIRTYAGHVNSSWNLGTPRGHLLVCPSDICTPPAKVEAFSINNLGINVFPNPTDGLLHVNFDLNNESEFKISMFDLAGRKVDQKIFTGLAGNNQINLNYSHVPKGMYLLQFTNGENSSIARIVIQ